jgi:hypothetical protein
MRPNITQLRGAPDLLAAFHFLALEKKLNSVAPVAILGASNHAIHSEALARFKGKSIRLYPHLDASGQEAAYAWANQLHDAAVARVTAFDFSGLSLMDGRAGKDLADVCRISADCFEREQKFSEVMP